MNADTLKTIASVIGMLNPALGVIGTFASSFGAAGGKVAKVTGAVQDAVGVATALMPFVEQFGRDEDFTLDDVRASLAGFSSELAKLDAEIARQKAAGG